MIGHRAITRLTRIRLSAAFNGWIASIDDDRYSTLNELAETTTEKLKRLETENLKLRSDNERFVRLIDSGEWGRGRIQELKQVPWFLRFAIGVFCVLQAGDVLRLERDALQELVRNLKTDLEIVQNAKTNQEKELRKFKDNIAAGGSTSAIDRNKLLVKGASSFNALVRALKQDLIENRSRTPEHGVVGFEVDKLSMDRVHVFPDGELKIEAVRKRHRDPQ
eukprot:g628.t1